MKGSVLLYMGLTLCAIPCKTLMSQTIQPEIKRELIEYLRTHHQTPEDYVLSKFKAHDIVFLGEWHRIKHDLEFVQKLIPLLHSVGVHYLGFEFARRVDQQLIDSLLSGPAYDEQLARFIIFKQFVHWGYQEYVDIFKTAWNLNHSLPAGSRRFRILGLNNSPDWSLVKTQEERDKGEVLRKVWHGETEEDWAKVLVDDVISRGQKALVYCGIHHAFTEYRQPIAVDGKFIRFGDARMGNHVFQKIGKQTFTIFLHAPWFSADGYDKAMVLPADGYIDTMLKEIEREYQRAGFDLKGTPFGRLPGGTSIYKFGYDHFTLETIYDGYVCQGPLTAYKGVTAIRNFVNERNLEEARAQSPNPFFRNATIQDFYESAVEDADIPRRLSLFK